MSNVICDRCRAKLPEEEAVLVRSYREMSGDKAGSFITTRIFHCVPCDDLEKLDQHVQKTKTPLPLPGKVHDDDEPFESDLEDLGWEPGRWS